MTGKRIFIVDDMPLIASTLGTIFERAGFVSTAYEDPLELPKACEHDVPDAGVSDVMMPQMMGLDLALRLQDLYPVCKVILMSGMLRASDLLRRHAWACFEFHGEADRGCSHTISSSGTKLSLVRQLRTTVCSSTPF